MNSGIRLYNRAKEVIPGGTQLLSKRPEMFLPDGWPSYYSKASGAFVWDLDDNRYTDFVTMGIGACPLGFANPVVDEAVIQAIRNGSMSTLNPPEEVELAELLCEIHPWAEMARFTRSGGEAMTVAIRIARAAAGRSTVLFSGYHGWHDWYLSSNLADDEALDGHLLPGLEPVGVPRELTQTAIGFRFNDPKGLKQLYAQHKEKTGVIVLETIRNEPPNEDFLREIERIRRDGVVFVVDEITSGWRLNVGGAHLLYGIKPDIAVFAKGMSNGYPMGAVVGTRNVMDAAQRSFISSTFWTERIGPVAALTAIKEMQRRNLPTHLSHVGTRIETLWKECAQRVGINISTFGIKPLIHFSFKGNNGQLERTVFTKLMLDRGVLASSVVYASLAHSDELIDEYERVAREVFSLIPFDSLEKLKAILPGEIAHTGFARLN